MHSTVQSFPFDHTFLFLCAMPMLWTIVIFFLPKYINHISQKKIVQDWIISCLTKSGQQYNVVSFHWIFASSGLAIVSKLCGGLVWDRFVSRVSVQSALPWSRQLKNSLMWCNLHFNFRSPSNEITYHIKYFQRKFFWQPLFSFLSREDALRLNLRRDGFVQVLGNNPSSISNNNWESLHSGIRR